MEAMNMEEKDAVPVLEAQALTKRFSEGPLNVDVLQGVDL